MSLSRFVALTWILVAVGCSGDGPYGGNPPPPPPQPPPPPGPNAVDVRDNFFTPVNLDVLSGATVTWTWRGSDQHNVTFADGQGSSTTKTSGTHSRNFPSAGTFSYQCTIHGSSMTGSVIVQ